MSVPRRSVPRLSNRTTLAGVSRRPSLAAVQPVPRSVVFHTCDGVPKPDSVTYAVAEFPVATANDEIGRWGTDADVPGPATCVQQDLLSHGLSLTQISPMNVPTYTVPSSPTPSAVITLSVSMISNFPLGVASTGLMVVHESPRTSSVSVDL